MDERDETDETNGIDKIDGIDQIADIFNSTCLQPIPPKQLNKLN